MDKYSAINANNRILEVMSDLTFIREKIAELIENPTNELADEIDGLFQKLEKDNSALRSSVIVLAKAISGDDTEEGQDFDVLPDNNGLRMN